MLIPDHKIDEIRERTDLVALVQRHGVELKKSGRSFKGCCPFHNEKTPSFHVWPEERRFKCFGCNAGGDAFSFVQRLLGKTFVDTVRDLAKECGVDLEAAIDPAMKEKAQIKEATDFAQEHFKARLWDPVIGKAAREYLLSRGVTEEVARQFGLGWAPNLWSDLADKLREHGLLGFAERGGLVAPRQRADGYYDMFRGRLIIPIRSAEGRSIAFGGRLLEGDNGPKYLNSRESKLYNKSETLYALDVAREEIRKKKSAVLCEGYFDAIGLHQAGVKNAVALCSTALTPGHMTALQRAGASELILLLDGDAAGRAAVERLSGPILAAGQSAKVAMLPDGEDPDTYARKVGEQGVHELLAKATPLTSWLFSTVLPHGAAASFEEKMAAVARLKPVAAQLPVGLSRSAFFGAMAGHFGLPAIELEAELKGKAPQLKPVPKPAAPATLQNQAAPMRPLVEKPVEPLEAYFVAAVLRDKRLLAKDTWRVADELHHSGARALLAAVASGTSAEDALHESSPKLKQALAAAMLPPDDDTLERAFADVCLKLKKQAVRRQMERITRDTAHLANANELDPDTIEKLKEQEQLKALLKELEGKGAQSRPA